jgi:hypothetical protein
VEKTIIADPLSLVNQHFVHQTYLTRWTTKAQKTYLHPNSKSFPARISSVLFG